MSSAPLLDRPTVVPVPTTATDRDLGIGEVSELTGLSVDTLRWYEREGLLPLVGRRPGGQRRYPPPAVAFVRLVSALRRTGMSVADVRAFVQMDVGLSAHASRMALLEEHRADILRQAERLWADLVVVEAKIEHHRDLLARGLDCEDELPPG